ncbi:hypothetical protein GE061_012118 [Apolygus lucorum]|uniref:Nucleoporin NSP1-like C-terminal domain-containing protein n=1 Tax=Apolygus lucorum TaxID=248454 RepID=A0A8S9XVH5_APOLU|nr:hypothetical protein GE061_012118 [Apolygus lucorum]
MKPPTTTAPPTLSGAQPLTLAPAGGLSLGAKLPATSAAPVSTATTTPSLGTALGATKPAAVNQLSFSQLEDSINKWTSELAEEERTFLAQATQINAWDKAINENEGRLNSLNNSVKQVQDQQTRINYDLDFILTQLRDLEHAIAPLEKDGDSYLTLKSEPQRKQLYLTAKQIDSQMKRLSEDLKEVIEQINEASRSVDTSDPVLQVGRVLDAHMDSLQMIDENATRVRDNLESESRIEEPTEIKISS